MARELISSRVKALANFEVAGAVLEVLLIKLTNVEICRMFYSVPDNLIYKLILVRKILCLYGRDRIWNGTLLRQPLTTSFICFWNISIFWVDADNKDQFGRCQLTVLWRHMPT